MATAAKSAGKRPLAKKKAKPRLTPELDRVSLADLMAAAQQCEEIEDWASLAQLGRTPLNHVVREDRDAARVWMLRLRIACKYPTTAEEAEEISDFDWALLRKDLFDFVREVSSQPHREPEFSKYLATLEPTLVDMAGAFPLLLQACQDVAELEWLRALRSTSLVLMQQHPAKGKLSAAEKAMLAHLPPILPALASVYEKAGECVVPNSEAADWLGLAKMELTAMLPSPVSIDRIAAIAAGLASPDKGPLPKKLPGKQGWREWQVLTPAAAAFLWQANLASTLDDLRDVVLRHEADFACSGVNGLMLLGLAMVAGTEASEDLVPQALAMLAEFGPGYQLWREDIVATGGEGGVTLVELGGEPLHLPRAAAVIQQMMSLAPADFAWGGAMRALVALLDALAARSDTAVMPTGPELKRVFEACPALEVAALQVAPDFGLQVSGLVEVLSRGDELEAMPLRWAPVLKPIVQQSATAQADRALAALQQLSSFRDRLGSTASSLWLALCPSIFKALSAPEALRPHTLDTARLFEADLFARGDAFRLAYLEQVAGDPLRALDYYVRCIIEPREPNQAVDANLRLIVQGCESAQELSDVASALQAAAPTIGTARLEVLLEQAAARDEALQARDALESSVASRWPVLSHQARQVLSALVARDEFDVHPDLGRLSCMTQEWAVRHHARLVRDGMLIRRRGALRLNPLVPALIEQSARHRVEAVAIHGRVDHACRPIFDDRRYPVVHRLLLQVFPHCIVAPATALQALIRFDEIKRRISRDDLDYFKAAWVDFAVVSWSHFMPLMLIDISSAEHESNGLPLDAQRKERVLSAAGLPMLRMRLVGAVADDDVSTQARDALLNFLLSMRDLPDAHWAGEALQQLG